MHQIDGMNTALKPIEYAIADGTIVEPICLAPRLTPRTVVNKWWNVTNDDIATMLLPLAVEATAYLLEFALETNMGRS
jgi:hypothetical protein